MGRPPMGKRAMSATERQRRWRAKKQVKRPTGEPVLRVSMGANQRLQVRIHELEVERAALRMELEKIHVEVIRFMRAWAGSWTLNKARVHELETKLAGERARRDTTSDVADLPMTYRKKYEVARRGLQRAFNDLVKQEAHRLLDELFLASSVLDDGHSSLDNVLDGHGPFVPKTTGYQDLRAVPRAKRRGTRATRH